MNAVTLINPTGEKKELTNVEFFALKIEFSKAKAYIQWATANQRTCWTVCDGVQKFSPYAVDDFLTHLNYIVIHN